MGRIVATIKVENLLDVMLCQKGQLPAEQVRCAELEALVDTGATLLCLPSKVIEKLGLHFPGTRIANAATGPVESKVFSGARLTVLDRTCSLDVMELEDGVSPLLGYIPLENLDLQPDAQEKALAPNPRHGDKIVLDLF